MKIHHNYYVTTTCYDSSQYYYYEGRKAPGRLVTVKCSSAGDTLSVKRSPWRWNFTVFSATRFGSSFWVIGGDSLAGVYRKFIAEVDTFGDIVREKYFDLYPGDYDIYVSIDSLGPDRFVINGVDNTSSDQKNITAIIDTTGAVLHTHITNISGYPNDDSQYRVQHFRDHLFWVYNGAPYFPHNPLYQYDYYLALWDTNGVVHKNFTGMNDTCNYSAGLIQMVDQQGDKLWMMGGVIQGLSCPEDRSYMTFICVDTFGVVQYRRYFEYFGPGKPWYGIRTSDGGFLLAYESVDTALGGSYAQLVKLDSMGCLTPGCAPVTSTEPVVQSPYWTLYPNPTSGWVEVVVPPSGAGAELRLCVLDAAGRTLREVTVPIAGPPVRLNLEGLPAGLYSVLVYQNGQPAWQGRVVKE